MNLLAGTYYDPAGAANAVTTGLLAMTALDTTNLSLTFTAPPSGRVRVVIAGGCIHGATTFPQILVGCLESSPSAGTVRGRQAPQGGGFNGTALATTQLPVRVDYIQIGLTPGQAYTWRAAYSVEILLAATGWKYGGPNNTTTNDAFGGISFEIWDPSPIYTPNAGAAPTATIDGRLPTALVSGRIDASVGAMAANVLTATAINADAITAAKIADGAIDAATFAAGAITATVIATGAIDADALAADAGTEIGTAVWATTSRVLTANTNLNDPTAAAIADAVWDELIAGHAGVGSTGAALSAAGSAGDPWGTLLPGAYGAGTAGQIIGDNLNATVSSRLATASYTAPLDAAGTRSAVGLASANLDTQLNALPTTAEVNAEVDTAIADAALATAGNLATLQTSVNDLPTNAELATALASADDAVLAAIAALNDFDPATEEVLANVQKINDVELTGDGSATPWGPA